MFWDFFEYQILIDNQIVSKCQVVGWLPIFPFMKRNGIHIGPCETIEKHRGKGVYPYLLNLIQRDFKNPCFMIVDENNISSIKGVEKAGFKVFANGYKTKFGRYVICNNL